MKSYTVPMGRLQEMTYHPKPDCTAYQMGKDFDAICKIWTSRGAMLQAVKMSDTGILGSNPWKPLVKGV